MNRLHHTFAFRSMATWLTVAVIMASLGANAHSNVFETAMKPGPTNDYWTALAADPSIYDTPYRITLFKPQNGEDGARVWSQTKSLFVYGLGVVGVLAVMPKQLTGWETEDDIFGKWVENVKEGPEWDRNNWIYNYVGHTYVGGVYYQVARKSGYRQWDSFFYSFLMSTFYWEYGVEAFAEPPSVQDLAVTPILGWVYGEWAYQTEMGIRDRGNEVLGSKTLGGISLFFLDPIDSLGRGVNWMAGRSLLKAGYGYFTYIEEPHGTDTARTLYLNMRFPIGGDHQPRWKTTSHGKIQYDPVDTGIVGIAAGTGHTMLDDKWGVENDFYAKLTLGLYFTPRTSLRFAYARSSLEERSTGENLIYENYSLDAQYYLCTRRQLRPYVTAGFGEQIWEEDTDRKSFQWNTGVGLHWQLHRKWALQADWINYFSSADETHDQNITVGIIYRFGLGEHNDW